MKKLISLLLVLAMACGVIACTAPQASTPAQSETQMPATEAASPGTAAPVAEKPAEQYVLKFNHVLAPSEPFNQGFLDWAERVKERTNGGLIIEVYDSAQLGVEEDIIEQIKQGVNVGQNTDSARLGMYVPDIAVMNAPYFVETIEDVQKIKELPQVKAWMEELETKHGIKVLSFSWIQGLRHILSNQPVKTPADLEGQRIRTPGAPIWQESIRAIGATPVAMNFGDVFLGIEQGSVDGADLVYRNVTGAKLYDVAKYMSETSHILLINFEIMSKAYFDKLPPEYQQILVEECDRAGLETSKRMEEEAIQLKDELRKNGVTIIEKSEIDLEAFKAAGEKAYETLGLTQVRDEIYKELGK